MKNILNHNGTTELLLANINDGSNTLFINDVQIASSSWAGSGSYTQVIEGTTITIDKIASDSGNAMLQKVSTNHYQLIEASGGGSGNYIIWS